MIKSLRMIALVGAAMLGTVIVCPLGAGEAADAEGKSADPKNSKILKVAITKNFFMNLGNAVIKLVMQPFPEIVKTQTNLPGSISLSPESKHLAEQLEKGECHLAVFQSHEFLWARAKNPKLKALMLAENKSTPLKAYLIVNKESKIKVIGDLAKKEVLVPGNSRPFAEAFLKYQCCKPGVALNDFYSSVRKVEDAEMALDELAEGKGDAVLAEKAAWERYVKRKPNAASNLEAISESEDFIPAVIACIPENMPDGWCEIFKKGMIAANGNPKTSKLMLLVKISSFIEVPSDFEDRAAEQLKRYPVENK